MSRRATGLSGEAQRAGLCVPFACEVTLRILTLAAGAGSFFVGAAITFAVIRLMEADHPELAFIVGAILGTELAALVHHRQEGTTNSFATKATVGLALAVAAVVVGITLHLMANPFHYPEISIPMAAVGSFVFPFVLFDTMWNALSKPKGD